jgi:hypothetical protein
MLLKLYDIKSIQPSRKQNCESNQSLKDLDLQAKGAPF